MPQPKPPIVPQTLRIHLKDENERTIGTIERETLGELDWDDGEEGWCIGIYSNALDVAWWDPENKLWFAIL